MGEIRLSLVEGDVQIMPEGTEDWFPASVNTPVLEGDRIWVPEGGRLEIQLRDATMIRLRGDTSLDVIRTEGDAFQFYLNSGSLYVNFTGKKRYLQIDTRVSSIRVYDGAKFRIDLSEDGSTELSTYTGLVYVESANGRTSVRAGNMLSMRDERYAELSPLGPPDEWERWNRDRDRRFTEKRYGYRYLPDELIVYSHDLDENGRWVYVREYGYVWTPTVIVSVEWAPYRYGRWVWIGGDYVWISYEPWGWVPYHYGRWAFVASIGWCWVPPARGAVYWGPGFVGWVYTPTYVAWVPLAPGEVYYGYGYYGPNSVNIVNIDIHNVVVKEYKNVYINNAVTIVHKDTFLTGKPVEVKVKENPFLVHRSHIGRPPLDPIRETRMPVIRDVMRGKEPPQRIREIDIRRIREERQIVKQRDISVIKPGAKVRELPIERAKRPPMPEEERKVITKRPGSFEENVAPSKEKEPTRGLKGNEPVGKPFGQRQLEERRERGINPKNTSETRQPQMIRKEKSEAKGPQGIKKRDEREMQGQQGVTPPTSHLKTPQKPIKPGDKIRDREGFEDIRRNIPGKPD